MNEGRRQEGNALVAAELNPQYELIELQGLVEALCRTKSIEEVEPLVLRYQEASKAERGKEGFRLRELGRVRWVWWSSALHQCAGSSPRGAFVPCRFCCSWQMVEDADACLS